MMLVLAALMLILAASLVGYLLVTRMPNRPASQWLLATRDRLLRRPPPPTVSIINDDGETINAPYVANTGPTVRAPRYRAPRFIIRRQTVAVAIGVLIGLVALTQLPRLVSSQPDTFIVLVAPFQDAGGGTQSGSVAAQQLAALIEARDANNITVRVLDDAPATVADALTIMNGNGADALVSGQIAAGGLADQQSLLPVLVYRPTGNFAPTGLDGYTARFALPASYPLATAPVNGAVVLPRLLQALQQYGAGQFDGALDTLGALADDQPALRPELLRSIRGNILWASGEYTAAADEYRRIGALQGAATPSPEAAQLANNLGAILQDGGDPAAADVLGRAIQMLNGSDLGQLRVNLALQWMAANQPAQAVQSLEQAQHLLAPSATLDLLLSRAYRGNRQFTQALAALQHANNQISDDLQIAPDSWQAVVDARLKAAMAEETASLQLTQTLDAYGPLFWELLSGGVQQRTDAPTPDALTTIHRGFDQAVQQTDDLAHRWRRQAASEDAAGAHVNGRIDTEQAVRAERALQQRERLLAGVEIELSRAQRYTPPQGFLAFWTSIVGDRSPVGDARDRLSRLLAVQQDDVEAQVQLGRAWLLSGKPEQAAAQFDRAAASGRPEPLYGQALIAFQASQYDTATERLNTALGRDSRFYPARELLATIGERQNQWAAVIEQRRALAQQFAVPERQLDLGRALWHGGSEHYTEAEQVLLPLANDNNADANNANALLELGQMYEQAKAIGAAQNALTRASAIAPRNPQVAFYLGQAYAAQNNVNQAAAQYRIAIDADSRFIDAYLALAALYPATSADATRASRQAIDAGLNDPAALKRIGGVLLETGDYPTAITAYQRALEAAPNDAEAFHGLAQANLKRGDIADARTNERQALAVRNDQYPVAWAGLGDIELAAGNAGAANDAYATALRQDSQLVQAAIGLGRASAAAGNWSVARDRFQQAATQFSGSAEAHLWLGEAQIRQNDTPGAIASYQRALEINPAYPEALFGLAQAQLANQQADLALANVNKALAERPAYAEALLLKGNIQNAQGDLDAASDSYSAAIDANSDLGEPYYRRALLRVRANQTSSAEDDLETAVARQDNFPEAHYWLGRMYLVDNRTREAQTQFAKAITQRQNNYPEAALYNGLAQEQLGDHTSAMSSFQTVVNQARNSAWAREAEQAITRLRP